MSKPDPHYAFDLGWNAHLDSKSTDENPWTECSDAGYSWVQGMLQCEQVCDALGTDNVERKPA